jgi:hypothetical protein
MMLWFARTIQDWLPKALCKDGLGFFSVSASMRARQKKEMFTTEAQRAQKTAFGQRNERKGYSL